jgi:glycine cleavage system regulatory protein
MARTQQQQESKDVEVLTVGGNRTEIVAGETAVLAGLGADLGSTSSGVVAGQYVALYTMTMPLEVRRVIVENALRRAAPDRIVCAFGPASAGWCVVAVGANVGAIITELEKLLEASGCSPVESVVDPGGKVVAVLFQLMNRPDRAGLEHGLSNLADHGTLSQYGILQTGSSPWPSRGDARDVGARLARKPRLRRKRRERAPAALIAPPSEDVATGYRPKQRRHGIPWDPREVDVPPSGWVLRVTADTGRLWKEPPLRMIMSAAAMGASYWLLRQMGLPNVEELVRLAIERTF